MKKYVFSLLALSLILLISCGVTTREDIEDSSFLQKVEAVMVEGATLSEIRPSENELSEKEIMLKVAEAVVELGYYNIESADEIDPRLKNSKIETPEYVYNTNPYTNANGGYYIFAVYNDCLVAILTCNAEQDRYNNNFVGSYGPCSGSIYALSKNEIKKIIQVKNNQKKFTEPALIRAKVNGNPFEEEYWYVAAIDCGNGEVSKDVFLNPDIKVEEYLIYPSIKNYKPTHGDISKALETSNSETNIWGGIIKVEQELGYYKVIEANKTIIDSDGTPKALNDNSAWTEYRGKTLSSMYTGNITATKI